MKHAGQKPALPPRDSAGGSNRANSLSSRWSETDSNVSMASTHRHAATSPFVASSPKPVLVKDADHTPKTTGSVGLLVVGLGGANGTTLLAGVLANRQNLNWFGPQGQAMTPNYYGCITQLKRKGGGVGYSDRLPLANANLAAIGGWDIRPTKLGDALFQAQILDFDLVRQVRDEMNKIKVFRGVYDPRFIGESQHGTATHVLNEHEASTDSEKLKCLRADIRYFKWRNGLVGHTTVIWSASVEPNCELLDELQTSDELLGAIELTEEERGGPLPPSLLYATAALLEGCSFINGGSQNTVSCLGLADLASQQAGVYCLGTDFKAGQTKFKTAAVEYIRTMGLKPQVIASSNHLGNNDMKNLATSEATSTAKLRVKHDIFAPWEEHDLDHKVSIMYTPFINDEKRDVVEYTSLGFLGQIHTMMTYTRASDSVLCVPLMLDGAVWCDYFSSRSWPYDKVAKALAYLFKLPEGSAKGVDPGFFRQMQELETQVMAAHDTRQGIKREPHSAKKRVRIRADEKSVEWAIPGSCRVICAGLACVDMQLNNATGGDGGEGIESFEGEKSIGGGSVSMACKTLARLCHGAALDEGYMDVTPPVISSVIPLCKVGRDSTGDKLISLLEACGEACRNVEAKYIRARDSSARTALAVLPIYRDGRRGCFFDAASNAVFSAGEMVEKIRALSVGSHGPTPTRDSDLRSSEDLDDFQADIEQMNPVYGAFIFGYPHLLPKMQGEALAQVLVEARSVMVDGGILALDLNGVSASNFAMVGGLRSYKSLKNDSVLGAALEHVDIIHMNEDELTLLTRCEVNGKPHSQAHDDFAIASAADLFLQCGVGIVAVTRGHKGSYVVCNDVERFRQSPALPSWADSSTKRGCAKLPLGTVINSNGAGDAFTAGLVVAAMLRHTGMTQAKPGPEPMVVEAKPRAPVVDPPSTRESGKPKTKLTPYTLYMKEHYVGLKKQCNDDKKAIFSMCHELWENESPDVKALYGRRALEEDEGGVNTSDTSLSALDDQEFLDSKSPTSLMGGRNGAENERRVLVANSSLSLDAAVQFASLVAAYHVDVSTRDRLHVDIDQLIETAIGASVKEI